MTLRDTALKYLWVCEVLLLTPIILLIIGLFSIPTILYAASSGGEVEVTDFSQLNNSACQQVEAYSGEVCRETFVSLQMCFSGAATPPPPLNIPSLIDQEAGESDASLLVNGLSFLNPSPQCREAIIPFLCLYIFTLCDADGRLHTVVSEDCLELRDNICAEEWNQAAALLPSGSLPVCEYLPELTDECTGNNSTDTGFTQVDVQSTPNPGSQGSETICSKGFFFDANITNICRPICGEFNPRPLYSVIFFVVSPIAGSIATVVVIVNALTVQRKKLLVIPLVFYVYLCISAEIIFLVSLVGIFVDSSLFCGSRDFLASLEKENLTPFCVFTGITSTYALLQVPIWGALFTVFLFWGVAFPFSFRQLKNSGRIRYAHIISVVFTMVIPLPFSLVHLDGGLGAFSSPPITCLGLDSNYSIYLFVLPLSVTMAITSCLFMLTFWTILKEFVIKKLLAGKKLINVGRGEMKIALAVIFVIITGIMNMVVYTRGHLNRGNSLRKLEEHIICESMGESADCTPFEKESETSRLTITGIVLICFLPVVVLLVTCDPSACKKSTQKNQPVTSTTR